MRFINILQDLKNEYKNDYIVRGNGTLLLGPDKIPNCRHMLFRPLNENYIQSYLILEYKNKFPESYIDFLKYSNGANLYGVKLNAEGVCFAHSMFVIFGLPMTAPFGRALDREEPFDLRVEDLARHDAISDKWLKCGTYIRNYDFDIQNDIFIDTETNHIFACKKNTNEIVDGWECLDECLCSVFASFADSEYEYQE